jgi:3-hydroxybutyryl-CoA dehydrogenase
MTADDVKRILVVGAGQMGAQIAMQSALHGYQLTLNDLSMEVLQKGMTGNRKQLERRVQKGQMTKDQMEEAMARVRLEPDLEKAARDADFVIEAIVERLEPKKECFAKLDRFCPPHAILATNSSTLMNSQIAPSTKRPDKCVNMHYFYPPLVMKLVEVVKGQWTSEETVEITAEVTRRSGREAVVLRKELPGFLVNRILRALGAKPTTASSRVWPATPTSTRPSSSASIIRSGPSGSATCPGSTSATMPGSKPMR